MEADFVKSWKLEAEFENFWKLEANFKKNCKLETDFEKLGKLENFMEKLGSWKVRRKCEVGVNYGEMGELKKKIKFYFNVKTNRYEGSYICFGLSNINLIWFCS